MRHTVSLVSLKGFPIEVKKALLGSIGYGSDEVFVLDKNGKKVLDRYTGEPIRIDNMMILPGSDIVLDSNPVSIASYLEEYPNRI